MRKLSILALLLAFFSCTAVFAHDGTDSISLTPEEKLWLQSRNNTIVVYPENNNPPFVYQTPGGAIEGLSVDYIELIADKLGITLQYLTPRSKSQILQDMIEGKGDIALSVGQSEEREKDFLFSESFVTVPTLIVVRKDVESRKTLTLSDFSGKRVALVEGSPAQEFVKKNYPRVVTESVTDDEVGLQKIILGETDAAIMDAASLSYLLSKQVMNSVKVVGSAGLDYKPAFAMTKDKEILQSVLEKGMAKINASDRQVLIDKWVVLPGENPGKTSFFQDMLTVKGMRFLYLLLGISVVGMFFLVLHRKKPVFAYSEGGQNPEFLRLQGEVAHLEHENHELTHELEEVKMLEKEIVQKIEEIKK